MVQRRIFRSVTKYQFQMGGALIAILGGDGAGKTTAIDSLYAWLSKTFEITKVHIGKPAWSPITVTIRSLLKIGQLLGLYPLETSYEETLEQKSLVSPGYPFLIREVCRARDRYQTYLKARRFAAKGGLVLLDRFPRPEIKQMDGLLTERFIRDLQAGAHPRQFLRPSMDSRFARFLIRLEESYYYRISPPELMLVLRVPPEVAVERKTDEDPAMVRARSTEMWNINWEQTDVQAIDSNRPKENVLGDLKAVIWSRL